MNYRSKAIAALLLAVGSGSLGGRTIAAQSLPRERISIDGDWRFKKDDPPGHTGSLVYDVRPEVRDERDDRPADAEPQAAAEGGAASIPTLKRWILPTGNPFIKDTSARHKRPSENRGGDAAYVRRDFDDSSWALVDLPHDWAIAGPWLTTGPHGGMGRLPSWGVGWYRKKLHIAPADAGQSIFLDVDGAMSYATVWLNGQIVGGWPYGYSSWRVDLTPFVNPGGENLLAIRLDNPPSSSRWYPGGGIYRNVWLTRTHALHVGHWGTFARTRDVSSSSATIDVDVTIDNDSPRSEPVTAATRIYVLDAGGAGAGRAVASIAPVEVTIAPRSNATVAGSITMPDPRLWGPPPNQRPNRYLAVTTITHRGRTVDSYETRFGILSSENAAALSSRGEYMFPAVEGISAPVRDGRGGDPERRHVSAYELYTAPFGSSADKVFASLERRPYVAGGFVWSGWDYLGEPTPYYSARSSYFGIIDLAGFRKDRFYL